MRPGLNPASSLSLRREVYSEMQHKHDTNLLGLDSGLAAVSSIVVTEGSVVDRITVVVSHERLHDREGGNETKPWKSALFHTAVANG